MHKNLRLADAPSQVAATTLNETLCFHKLQQRSRIMEIFDILAVAFLVAKLSKLNLKRLTTLRSKQLVHEMQLHLFLVS